MLENGFLISINRQGNHFLLPLCCMQAAGDKPQESIVCICSNTFHFSPKTIIYCQSVSFGDWRQHSKLRVFHSKKKEAMPLTVSLCLFFYFMHYCFAFNTLGCRSKFLIDGWACGQWFLYVFFIMNLGSMPLIAGLGLFLLVSLQ